MKAQIVSEQKPIEQAPLRFIELPDPQPAPAELLLRVRACGVCRTDLHIVEGDIPLRKKPVIPGHQVVATVEALGAEAHKFEHGERVGVVWLYQTCGECQFCLDGRENLCEKAQFTGLDADGGYAELMLAPAEFAHRILLELPDEEVCPLLCGGVIGYRAFKLSEAKPGQTLGLYGFGNSAHITIQLAVHLGCIVYVFTRSPSHQEHARELGASWVGRAEDDPPSELDSAIIFAPSGKILPEALRVLKPGGTVALAGIYMSPIPELPHKLLYRERTVRSVANCTRADVRELLELARKAGLKTTVTTFPLSRANDVLFALKESGFKGDAVLVP